MDIVGIHDGHNASVAYLRDGELVYAVQEERLTREKNASGFPAEALEHTLTENDLTLSEVDHFVLANNHLTISDQEDIRSFMIDRHRQQTGVLRKIKDLFRDTVLYDYHKSRLEEQKARPLVEKGVDPEKIHHWEHHSCHASAAYYSSHYDSSEEVLVFTCDGGGDKLCATVSIGHENELERVESIGDEHSLGSLYAATTYIMGMVPGEHEYKIMGLAPYVIREKYEDLLEEFKNVLWFDSDDSLTWSRREGVPSTHSIVGFLEDMLEHERFDRVAGAIQAYTEELLTEWVRRNVKHYGIEKLALAGGVFMNVKANQAIAEIPGVEDLFAMPSCGDETNSFGAAAEFTSEQNGNQVNINLNNMYLGPSLNTGEIEDALEELPSGYEYEKKDDIEATVTDLLVEDKIVARCKGRMEFGARALGNRSILANPKNPDNVEVINDMIKKRDFWMPFAGSFLPEAQGQYILNPKNLNAPYMIMTFDTVEETVDDIICAVHRKDHTTRPQFIQRETAPDYFRLVEEFHDRTGVPGVLNTSFNLHGLPIVCRPEEALKVLMESGLRHLALGSYHVRQVSEAPAD